MVSQLSTRLHPPVSAHDHVRGPRSALVSLVEYGDFECPYCRAAVDIVNGLRQALGDQLSFTFRHFPMRDVHPHAQHAAEVAEVATAQGHPGIPVHLNSQVTGLEGDTSLTAVHVKGLDNEDVLPCSGLFSLIGAEPSSEWLSGCAALDEHGFVLTDLSLNDERLDDSWRAARRRPLPFESSKPGLFAVGDLRSGSMKRVASAVGEGSAAVRSVHQYLAFNH